MTAGFGDGSGAGPWGGERSGPNDPGADASGGERSGSDESGADESDASGRGDTASAAPGSARGASATGVVVRTSVAAIADSAIVRKIKPQNRPTKNTK